MSGCRVQIILKIVFLVDALADVGDVTVGVDIAHHSASLCARPGRIVLVQPPSFTPITIAKVNMQVGEVCGQAPGRSMSRLHIPSAAWYSNRNLMIFR
jgi:hypothetical protein